MTEGIVITLISNGTVLLALVLGRLMSHWEHKRTEGLLNGHLVDLRARAYEEGVRDGKATGP